MAWDGRDGMGRDTFQEGGMPLFSKVPVMPLCFYKRATLAPVFLPGRNPKRIFAFAISENSAHHWSVTEPQTP